MNFQDFVIRLTQYWTDLGCLWSQPYDLNMGAGTFHPHTFLKGIGPEPWRAVYVQPCRRPVDGRYGESTYRFQHYYQLQVLLKPSPANIVDLFLKSLEHVGICLQNNDVGLLEDDWKGPTLGAWGLGWEVRANGQEVSQFTYFQQLGGVDIEVVSGEITYGLERLYMYAFGLKDGNEIPFNDSFTYGDIFRQNEVEFSHYNFTEASVPELLADFVNCERNVVELCAKNLVLPAYDYTLKASHAFNLLDSRGAVSVTERQRYIGRVRECARTCAEAYQRQRLLLNFPMLNRLNTDARLNLTKKRVQELGHGDLSSSLMAAESTSVVQRFVDLDSEKSRNDENCLELLFEVGVEEMPPAFQKKALISLKEFFANALSGIVQLSQKSGEQAAVCLDEILWIVTARRLGLAWSNLPKFESDRVEELWGPAERISKSSDGELSPAGKGFLKKNALSESEAVFKAKGDGSGVFLYAKRIVKGREMSLIVSEVFQKAIESLEAPLVMRWLPPALGKPFVRPVRWIVALANGILLPVNMFGLVSNTLTYGTRVQNPQKREVFGVSGYLSFLSELGIEPDWQKRRGLLKSQLEVVGFLPRGASVVEDKDLLDKLTGLSETPVLFTGKIKQEFLRLPKVLITSVLKEHMNYFGVSNEHGSLLPDFVGFANYKCKNFEDMVQGAESVVDGRLADGAFYYDNDLKTPLDDFRERLKYQTFQEGMGSLFDKTQRVGALARRLVEAFGEENIKLRKDVDEATLAQVQDAAELAGQYCKADLRTGCVQEFPDEMQGVMGGIMVSHQRPFGVLSDGVSRAITLHYEPKNATAELPSGTLAAFVSLADKTDSLCMFLAFGEDLKGNKDPFGLRRFAIAVLRLLGMEGDQSALPFSLHKVIRLGLLGMDFDGTGTSLAASEKKILEFLNTRLKAFWKQHYDAGAVEAVLAKANTLTLAKQRSLLVSLSSSLKESNGMLVEGLVPYRRARTLVNENQSSLLSGNINEDLLTNAAEKELLARMKQTEIRSDLLLSSEDFTGYFGELAQLTEPLKNFFDGVMVLDTNPNLRSNRLQMLSHVCSIYDKAADFSLLQM